MGVDKSLNISFHASPSEDHPLLILNKIVIHTQLHLMTFSTSILTANFHLMFRVSLTPVGCQKYFSLACHEDLINH